MDEPTRRRLLGAAGAATLAAVAGCSGGGGGDATTTAGSTPTSGNGNGGNGNGGNGNGGNGNGGGTPTPTPTPTTPTPTPYPTPDVAFESVYNAEKGVLLIVLAGANTPSSFTASNTDTLAIHVDGERTKTWELPVEVSDQTSVEASSGSTVEIVWTGPTGKTETLTTIDVS